MNGSSHDLNIFFSFTCVFQQKFKIEIKIAFSINFGYVKNASSHWLNELMVIGRWLSALNKKL